MEYININKTFNYSGKDCRHLFLTSTLSIIGSKLNKLHSKTLHYEQPFGLENVSVATIFLRNVSFRRSHSEVKSASYFVKSIVVAFRLRLTFPD